MKTAINKTNKTISFPALTISFSPKESKSVTDEIAGMLSRDAAIVIAPIRSPLTTQDATHIEKRSREHRRSKNIIKDNNSDK